jgi:hypothetical protein
VTPAAVLFCTTLVTAVPHGSVVEHNCRFVEPPFTGTRTSALEVPLQSVANAKAISPTPQVAQSSQVAPVAPVAPIAPVARVAAPVSKPVVKLAKLYKPKTRRRIAHLTTFRRYGKIMVSPASSEISDKKEHYSFWEQLKHFTAIK